MNTTRRAALATFASLGIPKAFTPTSAAPLSGDAIPALLAERRRALHLIDEGRYVSEEEADALMDIWGACDAVATISPPTTAAGAIVSIEWAREELLQFGFSRDNEDNGARLVLAFLEGAVGVLRKIGGIA